jgi:hypothetical protein
MFNQWQSHKLYQQQVLTQLSRFSDETKIEMQKYFYSIQKLFLLDLDPAAPIILPRYSATGRPACNQLGILRSMFLMCSVGETTSITKWAITVRKSPFLSAVCGFESDIAPNFNSYYDFISRFWGESYSSYRKRKNTPRGTKDKPSAKLQKNEKLNKERTGITEKLRKQIESGQFSHFPLEFILQLIFVHVAVYPSARMGLLGTPKLLDVSADGTAIYSGASPFGRKHCGCADFGIHDCSCKRYFSDVDANYGWDSHESRYYFGSTLFLLSVSHNKHDLPILFMLAQASRHDSVLGLMSIFRFQQLMPELGMDHFIADSAMDNSATYQYLTDKNISPVIALNERAAKNKPEGCLANGIKELDPNNVPICNAGLPLVNWGLCGSKGRKFRCPLAIDKKHISAPCRCSDSAYGRVFYVKPINDIRLNPPVPRGSAAWKKLFNKRSGAERVNKRILLDYSLFKADCRSNKHRAFRTFCASLNIHLDLWVRSNPPVDLLLALSA